MLDARNAGDRLGERLRELIEASPYNAAEVAKACGVTRAAVYGWLKTGRVHKRHLPKLANLLRTSVDGLLNEGAPTTRTSGGDVEWSFAAQKLATLFDHLPPNERQLAWPWLVHMIARSPALVRAFLPFPAENSAVEAAYGIAREPRREPRKDKK